MNLGAADPATIGREPLQKGVIQGVNLASGLIRMSTPIESGGALNKTGTFEKVRADSTIIMFISGSGYHSTGGAVIGMWVTIDGVQVADTTIYANPAVTHMQFMPRIVVFPNAAQATETITKGVHSVGLDAFAGTQTDTNDRHCLALFEIPTL
jgi:hypothetical protein